MADREKVMLVDGNNLVFRAIKAAESGRGMALSNPDGVNTGGLLLFINLLAKYVRYVQPDRLVVCFDHGVSLRRLAMYPDYKGNRPARSEEFEEEKESHFGLVKQWLSLAGVFHASVPHYEADDLIGHYWRALNRMDTTILSGDKDLLQLVTEDCVQIRPQTGFAKVDDEVWTVTDVMDEYGCTPGQLTLLKALMGDTSDNIKGVPGVGPKRALTIAQNAKFMLCDIAMYLKDPTQSDVVARNYELMDLRNVLGVELPEPPKFTPTGPDSIAWEALTDFYNRHALASIRAKMFTMWAPEG